MWTGKFQLRSSTRQRFVRRWKLPALFSLMIMAAVKAYDFGGRKGESARSLLVAPSNLTGCSVRCRANDGCADGADAKKLNPPRLLNASLSPIGLRVGGVPIAAGYFTCKSSLLALPPSPRALAGRLRRAQTFVHSSGSRLSSAARPVGNGQSTPQYRQHRQPRQQPCGTGLTSGRTGMML